MTITRWLADARQELLAETRRELEGRLGIRGAELQSVLRLIQSHMGASVIRLLGG